MIVIVEGIDRVGKTTLCEMLERSGFILLKDSFGLKIQAGNTKFPTYSAGKLDTAIQYVKELNDKGYNVVLDRLHLTEYVYGSIDRKGNINESLLDEVDNMIEDVLGDDALLVLVQPDNIETANQRAKCDLTLHSEMFNKLYESSKVKKMTTNYFCLQSTLKTILKMSFDYDFYFASPFFRMDQIEREKRMKEKLRSLGYKVFSPSENCNLSPISDPEIQQKVFNDNVMSINNSIAVFAITDTKDMGTIWEAGYAFGVKRPVVYFAETLGDNQFNLMLAKSGKAVFTNEDDVTKEALDEILFGGKETVFKGVIE